MIRNLFVLALALGVVALGSACTKKEGSDSAPSAAANSASTTASTTIDIASVGETMAYDKTTLEVKAGSRVTLNLKNNATSGAMRHNWVLTKPGTADAIGAAGIPAGEAKGYIPDSPDIIAHTPLSQPGGSVSVTFTAPAPGEYPYVCTFPGHYAVMKGILKSVQ
jgi:azurin